MTVDAGRRVGRRAAGRSAPSGAAVLAAGLLGAVLLAGCSSGTAGTVTGADRATGPGVVAEAADVASAAPAPEPAVATALADVPAPGTVTVLDGPFTDRVVVHDASVADGRVSLRVDVVRDVSELLALELEIACYDAQGTLVGSTRRVVDPEAAESYHSTAGIADLPVDVAAPGAVTATLGIPVLVNE